MRWNHNSRLLLKKFHQHKQRPVVNPNLGLEKADLQSRIVEAIAIAEQYGMSHNLQRKQCVIDTMIRHLLGSDYKAWVNEYNKSSSEPWNEGKVT